MKVFTFFRVTKNSGLLIMYAKEGDKLYGGVRYDKDMDETQVKFYVANLAYEGELKCNSDELAYHRTCGRKVDELGCGVISDTDIMAA